MKFQHLCITFLGFLLPLGVWAQVIEQIEVEGTNRLERSQILFRIETRVGEQFNKRKIIRDVKTVYKMRKFTFVSIQSSQQANGNYILTFVVKERPRIGKITITGRTKVLESEITKILTLKEGDIFNQSKVLQDRLAIRNIYYKAGYTRVKITHSTQEIAPSKYEVVFRIEESAKIYITRLGFHGNNVFPDLRLERMMTSGEIDCISWVNESGVFQEDRINQDLALITRLYLENGYIKVRIARPKIVLTTNPDYGSLEIDLTFTEGNQYFTGQIELTGDLLDSKEELTNLLELNKSEVYNPFLQNRDRAALNDFFQERGYAFVRVIPKTTIHEDTRKVDVTYQIIKGEKAYLGRIDFEGNTVTHDYVIRREFESRERDLYNGKKLQKSQRNLERLGFFEQGLSIDRLPEEEEDNILNMLLRLKEASTGSFNIQVSYSEVSKLAGSVTISKGNLFGRGYTIRFRMNFAQQGSRSASLTFIEPRLLHSRISAEVSLGYSIVKSNFESRFDRREISFGLAFGIPLIFEDWSLGVGYSAINRLFNDSENPDLEKRTAYVELKYDTVDHPIFPSSGIRSSGSVSQTGDYVLGGNTRLREYAYTYRQFWSLNKSRSVIVMAQARLGFLEKQGDSAIPEEDRYRIGGISTVHGHFNGDISGPSSGTNVQDSIEERTIIGELGTKESDTVDERRLELTREELEQLIPGGISQRIFNLELLFPLGGDSSSRNIRGALFYDAGNVNAEPAQYRILKEEEPKFWDLRQSTGIGVRLITPMGVLHFDYGRKLDARKHEADDKFDFNISGLF